MKIIKFLTLLTIVSYFFSNFIFIFSLTGLLFCLMKKYSINDKIIKIFNNFSFDNDVDIEFIYFDTILLFFITTIYVIWKNDITSFILISTFLTILISTTIIFFGYCINIINNDNNKIISFISCIILDISILVSMFYIYFFSIKDNCVYYFGYLFLLIIVIIIMTYKEYNNLIKMKGSNFELLNNIKSKIYDFITNIVDVKITKNIPENIEDLFYNSSSWEIKTNGDGQKYVVFYGNEDNTEIKNYKIYLNRNLYVNLNISVKEIIMYFYNIFKNNNYNFKFNCGVNVSKNNITVNNQNYEISDIYSFLFTLVKNSEFLTYKNFGLFEDDNYNGIYFIIKTNKEIIFNILKNCKYYGDRFEYIHFKNPIEEVTNNDKDIVNVTDGVFSFSFVFNQDIEKMKKFLMN